MNIISGLNSYVRFHCVRLFRAHPRVFGACLASSICAVFSASAFVHTRGESSAAKMQLDQLRRASLSMSAAPVKPIETGLVVPNLPWFQSAQLVAQFSDAAADSKLPLDEVGYVLEEGIHRPYLRYRVTMTVTASYPVIRQFAGDVTATMTHVDLDSINCARPDILIAPLTCELAFSAFFRKDARG